MIGDLAGEPDVDRDPSKYPTAENVQDWLIHDEPLPHGLARQLGHAYIDTRAAEVQAAYEVQRLRQGIAEVVEYEHKGYVEVIMKELRILLEAEERRPA